MHRTMWTVQIVCLRTKKVVAVYFNESTDWVIGYMNGNNHNQFAKIITKQAGVI